MNATIGFSDIIAIGYPDSSFRQAWRMRKAVKKSFLDRAMDAYRDRFKEKPTQAKVAGLVGLKQPSANEWKQPGRYPELGAVVVMADKLGVAVEWLLTERGPKHVPPVDTDAEALWRLWPRLSALDRSKVVAYAETRLEQEDGPGSSAGAAL
jgi:transcriptional regulator with XRE-family HTH domain